MSYLPFELQRIVENCFFLLPYEELLSSHGLCMNQASVRSRMQDAGYGNVWLESIFVRGSGGAKT